MRSGRLASSVGLCLFLVACDAGQLLKRWEDSAETDFARQAFSLLHDRSLETLAQRLAPELRGATTLVTLQTMADQLPADRPLRNTLVGYHVLQTPDSRQVTVSLEYRFPTTYVLAEVVVAGTGPAMQIKGFHVRRAPESLETLNAFRLSGKSMSHYLMLGLAVLIPLLCLTAVVFCVRTPRLPRRWLWILASLVGVVTLSINWTTGEWSFSPLSFQLLGASVLVPGPDAPWTLSVSLPIGAIVFLLKRRSLIRNLSQPPHDPATFD